MIFTVDLQFLSHPTSCRRWYQWSEVEVAAYWRNPRPFSSERTLLVCRSPSKTSPSSSGASNLSPPARCLPHKYGYLLRMNMHGFVNMHMRLNINEMSNSSVHLTGCMNINTALFKVV